MAFRRVRILWLALLFANPLLLSCKETRDSAKAFSERFEQGSRHAYAAADVLLASGRWRLDHALIGRTAQDVKEGGAALRLAAGGSATMLFDIATDAAVLRVRRAPFGKDAASPISLWYSADGGRQWRQAGQTAPASAASQVAYFPVPAGKAIRFSVRNEGRGRVNVDDLELLEKAAVLLQDTGAITPRQEPEVLQHGTGAATRDGNMALGNPSQAGKEAANRNNYLLMHPQFALSYNSDKGIANWVSWHLSAAWRGDAPRCNCFFSDNALPDGFFRATTSSYTATGFDRGHLCPSEDRTASADDNAATFLMSNIAPQAPMLNQQPWARLEDYARSLTDEGFELYIIAGSYGQGGAGAKGASNVIATGRISVPAHYWKIMVVLPVGADDVQRISTNTRVIAVDMPNDQSVAGRDWKDYRTSIKSIEQATGYNFLNKVPAEISATLKNKVDGQE
jgi:endonuclease G